MKSIRTSILQKFLTICTSARQTILHKRAGKCATTQCPKLQFGTLNVVLQSVGLFPLPTDASAMPRSVLQYWKAFKTLDIGHQNDNTFTKKCRGGTKKGGKQQGSDCYEDFGVVGKAEKVLRKTVKDGVW